MPDWRRYYVPDSIVFITCVTEDRIPRLRRDEDVALFWETMRLVQELHPFHLLAHVTLPDHFHWLLLTSDPKGDFSEVMQSAKRNLTQNYKRAHALRAPLKLWQRGFWDHVVRNEKDLEKGFDYIHFNPVKHGYVLRPEDWPHSTYRHWLERGYYELGWGYAEPRGIEGMDME